MVGDPKVNDHNRLALTVDAFTQQRFQVVGRPDLRRAQAATRQTRSSGHPARSRNVLGATLPVHPARARPSAAAQAPARVATGRPSRTSSSVGSYP